MRNFRRSKQWKNKEANRKVQILEKVLNFAGITTFNIEYILLKKQDLENLQGLLQKDGCEARVTLLMEVHT